MYKLCTNYRDFADYVQTTAILQTMYKLSRFYKLCTDYRDFTNYIRTMYKISRFYKLCTGYRDFTANKSIQHQVLEHHSGRSEVKREKWWSGSKHLKLQTSSGQSRKPKTEMETSTKCERCKDYKRRAFTKLLWVVMLLVLLAFAVRNSTSPLNMSHLRAANGTSSLKIFIRSLQGPYKDLIRSL